MVLDLYDFVLQQCAIDGNVILLPFIDVLADFTVCFNVDRPIELLALFHRPAEPSVSRVDR